METINLPKGIDGIEIKPNSDVYVCFNGEKIHVNGFTFFADDDEFNDSIVNKVLVYRGDDGYDEIPVVYLVSKEPTEEEQLLFKKAILKAKLFADVLLSI